MPQTKLKRNNVRLSELDPPVACLIRPAVSEVVAWHCDGLAAELPLRRLEPYSRGSKKVGGSHGA